MMIKQFKNFKYIMLIIISNIITSAHAVSNHNYHHPFYVGLDAIYSRVHFRKKYGDNIFNKSAISGGIVLGVPITDSVGLEIGQELTKKARKSDVYLKSDDYLAGWQITGSFVNGAIVSTALRQQHLYSGLTFNSNFTENTFVSVLLGASIAHLQASYKFLYPDYKINQSYDFSKTKLLATIKLSLVYKLTDDFFIRIFTTWRDTHKFVLTAKQSTSGDTLKLNNYFNAGIGIVLNPWV